MDNDVFCVTDDADVDDCEGVVAADFGNVHDVMCTMSSIGVL